MLEDPGSDQAGYLWCSLIFGSARKCRTTTNIVENTADADVLLVNCGPHHPAVPSGPPPSADLLTLCPHATAVTPGPMALGSQNTMILVAITPRHRGVLEVKGFDARSGGRVAWQ